VALKVFNKISHTLRLHGSYLHSWKCFFSGLQSGWTRSEGREGRTNGGNEGEIGVIQVKKIKKRKKAVVKNKLKNKLVYELMKVRIDEGKNSRTERQKDMQTDRQTDGDAYR
jgi:hypothetical protein